MTSTFNLLTAGGARFDKSKYSHDIDLFTVCTISFKKSLYIPLCNVMLLLADQN